VFGFLIRRAALGDLSKWGARGPALVGCVLRGARSETATRARFARRGARTAPRRDVQRAPGPRRLHRWIVERQRPSRSGGTLWRNPRSLP